MWISKKEQIENATDVDLRRALITSDGAGEKIKSACLDELIKRIQQKNENVGEK